MLYNYALQPRTWKLVLEIVESEVGQFRAQAGVIIRKILNEQMRGLEGETENLLRICLKLVDVADGKSSIEAVHDIKMVLDLHGRMLAEEYRQGENQ